MLLLVLSALLLPGAAAVNVPRDTPYRLEIAPPAIVELAEAKSLQRACGVARRVYACTMYAYLKLDCECARGEDGRFSLVPSLMSIPVMFLLERNGRVLSHEAVHQHDVRRRIETYLTEIASRRFDSEEECRRGAAGEEEQDQLRKRINRMLTASNVGMGCE